jgi:hypothetical protein
MNELRNRGVEDILIAVVDGHFPKPSPRFSVGERADLHRALEPLLRVVLRLEGAPGPGSRRSQRQRSPSLFLQRLVQADFRLFDASRY